MNSFSPLRIGVLGSGKGSNFRALVEASQKAQLNYEPVIVISDRPDAGILKIAEEFGIPSCYIEPGPFKTKFSQEAEYKLVEVLQEANVSFIALAGFMRVIKAPLLEAFPHRILNIHPSLLPQFPGLEAWRQAYEAQILETGCSVHLVDAGIDTGKILGQLRVPILPTDSVEVLHARIQEAEHTLYPRIVNEFAKSLIDAS